MYGWRVFHVLVRGDTCGTLRVACVVGDARSVHLQAQAAAGAAGGGGGSGKRGRRGKGGASGGGGGGVNDAELGQYAESLLSVRARAPARRLA